MAIASAHRPWWLEPPSADRDDRRTGETGLTSSEAKDRLAKFGPNRFRERQEASLLVQYLTRFKNPLVLILLVASAVSAFTGEVTNFLIISCIVLLSVTLDFVQEYRANAAADKLRQSVSVRTLVLRDGKPLEIPVALAVGLTPELLPMVVSVTLSRGALRMARKHMIVKRLAHLKKSLLEAPAASRTMGLRLNEIERKLKDIEIALNGDKLREKYQEPFPPSVASRVASIVRRLWSTTAAPTGTQRDSYAVAAAQFAPLLNNLRMLVEDELKTLETTAEAAGAPWTTRSGTGLGALDVSVNRHRASASSARG